MIFLGADHAGYKTKEEVKKFLKKAKIPHMDLGTYSEEPVDYPIYAKRVVNAVLKTKGKGILVCGTGQGMCTTANRNHGIRASLLYDDYSAKMSRMHGDSNIACLRGRKFPAKKSVQLVKIWLNTRFTGDKRHKRRIKELEW